MSDAIILGVAAVVLAAVIGYGIYIVINARKSDIEDRLGQYGFGAEPEKGEEKGGSPIGERLEKAIAGRSFSENLKSQLAQADLKLTVSEFMAATVIVVIGLAIGAFILTRTAVLALVAGVVGFFVPRIYIGMQKKKRLKNFNDQLGDTITLMVNSIRAGYSALQAMEAVAQEMGPPTSDEFHRVVREVQLGISIEDALNNLMRRVPSDDLDLMITAMNVQREVGGNLAEVLDAISFTIRERVRILGEIRSLTAQGRYSGYLVSALPVFVAVMVSFINPEFTRQLIEKPCGWAMIALSVILEVSGYIVIQKIVNIEV
ncbi:MAG: type II secretion system F family protein [Anaerolineae bacterium]|nr:type II secretion system F family protein [Anaerolineae bacterium]